MDIKLDKSTIDLITRQLSQDGGDKIKAGYLTGRIEADSIIVDGIHIPEQKSGEVATHITPRKQSKAFVDIKASKKSIVGFITYHGPFAPYESVVTRETKEQLAKSGIPDLLLVINAKGDYIVISGV